MIKNTISHHPMRGTASAQRVSQCSSKCEPCPLRPASEVLIELKRCWQVIETLLQGLPQHQRVADTHCHSSGRYRMAASSGIAGESNTAIDRPIGIDGLGQK